MVVVAQLVRALVCGTRGRGFEPHLPPRENARHKSAGYFFALPPSSLERERKKLTPPPEAGGAFSLKAPPKGSPSRARQQPAGDAKPNAQNVAWQDSCNIVDY